MSARTIHRRSLLLGLGSGLCATALTRRLLSDEPPKKPLKRLIILFQNNGTQQANFWPTSGFTSPILQPLLSDPKIASKTRVVRGVFVPSDANGTDGNEHDMGFARMFTGAKLLSVGNHPWGGAASVDQLVARAWQTDSLTLAILTSGVEPMPKPGFDHRRSFCYVAPGSHKLPTLDPLEAYSRLFPAATPLDPDARKRLVLRKSALDAAIGNLNDVRARLGAAERAKLDLHLSAVRDLETKLARQLDGSPPTSGCALRPPAPRDYALTAPALLVNDEGAIPELVTTMLDLIAAGIGCGVTRIATLQLGYGGGKWKFAWEGINMDLHQECAHKDTSDAGSSPENTDRLVRANRYYASQVAYLAKKLDSMPEGNGTVLDNTLLVWANEFGRGDHNLSNVPIVLIGGAGGAIGRGGRLIDVGAQTFQRVGCTILRAMDIPAEGFGDAPTCGALQGL
jgi:hypothetical protein